MLFQDNFPQGFRLRCPLNGCAARIGYRDLFLDDKRKPIDVSSGATERRTTIQRDI
jgi:hypothetical protein